MEEAAREAEKARAEEEAREAAARARMEEAAREAEKARAEEEAREAAARARMEEAAREAEKARAEEDRETAARARMEEAAREAENTRAEEAAKAKELASNEASKASNSMAAKAKTSSTALSRLELAVAKAKAAIKRDKNAPPEDPADTAKPSDSGLSSMGTTPPAATPQHSASIDASPSSPMPMMQAVNADANAAPVNQIEATAIDQPATAINITSQSRSKTDPSRFDQPVNQGNESLNSLARAVEGALDSAIAKPPKRMQQTEARDGQLTPQTETGMIDTARLKAKVASLKAGIANPGAKPGPTPEPAQNLPQPPASLNQGAMLPSPANQGPIDVAVTPVANAPASTPPAPPVDKMNDAVSRLIEAAQKAPDSTTASAANTSKPEALNRKIEAVKKKIRPSKPAERWKAAPRRHRR